MCMNLPVWKQRRDCIDSISYAFCNVVLIAGDAANGFHDSIEALTFKDVKVDDFGRIRTPR